MKTFFITDNMNVVPLIGSLDERVDQVFKLLTSRENTGSLGVITSTFRVGASVQIALYQKDVHTKIKAFLRRYMVLETLETLADELRALASKKDPS